MKCLPRLPIAALFLSPLFTLAPASLSAQELHCKPCWHGFGPVQIGTSATFSVELKNDGTQPLQITSDSVHDSAFSIGTFPLPMKIPPGESVQLPIIFAPASLGHHSGTVILANTGEDSELEIKVGGSGAQLGLPNVYLSWNPGGDGEVVGYNVYRGTANGGPYQKINSSLDPATDYTDYSVQSGMTYYYVTTEVNAQGVESAYSNVAEAVIPN